MPTPVTDPQTLAMLNQGAGNEEAAPRQWRGLRAVEDQATLDALNAQDFGIDFSRPVAEVRGEVGKLSPEDRKEALRQWARAYVTRERGERSNAAPDSIRAISRGTLVGPFLDELTAGSQAALHSVTGGNMGSPYDESLAYQREQDRQADEASPILNPTLQVAGGLASARPLLSLPKTLRGRVALGAPVGAGHGALAGYGNAEGEDWNSDERWEGARRGAVLGGILGSVAPIAISGITSAAHKAGDALSPTLARIVAENRQRLRDRGINASADGATPETAGATEMAYAMGARALRRSNRTTDDIRRSQDEAADARNFGNSRGIDQDFLVEADEGLQRLMGSAIRANPEAARIAGAATRAQHTGITPVKARLEPDSGLATRPENTLQMTGAQTRRATGNDFGVPSKRLVAAGQQERLFELLKRAARVMDHKHHGHAQTTYRTEQKMTEARKAESDRLYSEARKIGQGIDIAPAQVEVFRKWSQVIADAPEEMGKKLTALMRNFFTRDGKPVGDITRFDLAKRVADGDVETAFKNTQSGNKEIARQMRDMRDEIVAAVDKVPKVGPAYAKARATHAGRSRELEMIELGRSLAKENSEVAADVLQGLNKADLKRARLGYVEKMGQRLNRARKRDATVIFDDPEQQRIMAMLLPTGKAVKFGRVVEAERARVETRNQIFGNSKTAERMADDEVYQVMEQASGVIDMLRGSGMVGAAIKFAENALHRMFGMPAEVSATLARQMFSADPIVKGRTLAGIEKYMGPTRLAMLADGLNQLQSTISRSTERAAIQAGAME